MNPTQTTSPLQRVHQRRRATPWPIRMFVVVAIVFGIWVDISTVDSNSTDQAASPTQTPLLGLTGEHSRVADVVRALASRR